MVESAFLEARMRQSGHYTCEAPLDVATFHRLLSDKCDSLDVPKARADIERFLVRPVSIK